MKKEKDGKSTREAMIGQNRRRMIKKRKKASHCCTVTEYHDQEGQRSKTLEGTLSVSLQEGWRKM